MTARVLSFAFLAISFANAQPPAMFRVTTFKVDPAHIYEFQDAQKLLNEAYKKSGAMTRELWATGIAGEAGTYVAVASVSGMAQFDGKSPVATSMSDADRQRYLAKMRNSVRESHAELARPLPDLSLMGDSMKADMLARVTTVHVLPGKYQEFEDVIKTFVLPALKKAGVNHYFVTQSLVGGRVGTYTTVTVINKYADPGALPLGEGVMGAEAFKQFQARLAACVASAETSFMRRVPDLSYPNP